MAAQHDQQDEHDDDHGLEISDEDAERLLDDPADRPARRDRRSSDRERRTGDRERRTRRGTETDDDDAENEGDGVDDTGLREQGRRALDAMKEQRRRAQAEARTARKELDELRQRLEQYESGNKSELQRLQEAAQNGTSRAEKAEAALRRREIAEERAPAHATLAQIKAVAKRLSGDNDDDLADDADELFDLLVPAPEPERRPARTTRRPEERLSRPRGGVDPEEDDDTPDDPRKLAEFIRSRGR